MQQSIRNSNKELNKIKQMPVNIRFLEELIDIILKNTHRNVINLSYP